MRDDTMRPDPLAQAVINALTAARGVGDAVAEADAFGWLSKGQLRKLRDLRDLRQSDVTSESFWKQEIVGLEQLAQSLEPIIEEETQRWFVYDECNMSGGHEETMTSAKGEALNGLRSALLQLRDRLSVVVNLLAAERIAKALRA